MIRALLAAMLTPFLLADTPPDRPMLPSWWMPVAGSGWIALALSEDQPQLFIPVTINGESRWAVVDTGFEGMVLSKRYADSHGLALHPYRTAESFGGRTTSYLTSSVSMAIGAMHTQAPATFAVEDLAGIEDISERPIDAVVGMGVLGYVGWEVDQDHQRIRFLPSGNLAMRHPVPLRNGPGGTRMVTDVSIEAAGQLTAVIDTGSDDGLLIDDDVAQRAHVATITDVALAGAGGTFVDRIGRLSTVTVGGVGISDPYVRIGSEVRPVMNQSVLIGMDLLRGYNLRVDMPSAKFELGPRMTQIAPVPKSTSGVQSEVSKGRLPIMHVMLNSPAATAGLKAGDTICGVNHWTAADADTRHWGRAAPGTRYTVHLCDGRTVPLVTRAFY